MAFIVRKKINGKDYFYLNENKRVDGKVKTKTLAYLGKTREDAEKKFEEMKKVGLENLKTKSSSPRSPTTSPSGEENNKNKIDKKMESGKKKMENSKVQNTKHETTKISVDEMAAFCKRKGFVYPSGEIYGGLSGFWDFGHLGSLLKKNFENVWRKYFLGLNDNFYEIEASEIMPEKVFVASGHLKNFNDVAAKCKKGHIERADHLVEKYTHEKAEGLGADELFDLIKKNNAVCSVCGGRIEYVGTVNMMFPVELGVGNVTKAYLRPETAQSPYVNFKTEFELTRSKLPLGLALVGRAYRNELSPRNMLLRQRAFTQAELQIFFNPRLIDEHEDFESVADYGLRVLLTNERDKGIREIKCRDLAKAIPKFYVYHMAKVQQFYLDVLGFETEKFRLYQLNEKEKAFYNKYHFDMEADLGILGWTEIGGIHYRTDHDLKGHQEVSKQNLTVMDEETRERFIPHVLELSFGVDRNFQTLLTFAYHVDEKRNNTVLHLHPKLAPVKAAVFPIVKKEEYEKFSEDIVRELSEEWNVVYDKSGSIGRRYARNDEIGTPFCITVDEDSLNGMDVTVRLRDSGEQVRIKRKDLKDALRRAINGEDIFEFGKRVDTRKKEE